VLEGFVIAEQCQTSRADPLRDAECAEPAGWRDRKVLLIARVAHSKVQEVLGSDGFDLADGQANEINATHNTNERRTVK
jgi:hypothetical protein